MTFRLEPKILATQTDQLIHLTVLLSTLAHIRLDVLVSILIPDMLTMIDEYTRILIMHCSTSQNNDKKIILIFIVLYYHQSYPTVLHHFASLTHFVEEWLNSTEHAISETHVPTVPFSLPIDDMNGLL
ncbi:unnamed protein product [Adineta steineri]|uniref:Uncharacterized protein n=1 Tax=Adineta steineri TaxID=433720 RepID=A0A819WW23_9BILA|nr:unnamed protein product [Adineta steineri]